MVCERGFDRKVENKRLCERRLCRAEMRRWPAVYLPFQPQTANVDKPGTSEPEKTAPLPTIGNVQAGPQKAHEIRTKTRTKSLGGWCWVERLQAGFKPGVDHVEARSLHDRERRLAAQIAQEGEGWWVAYPVMTQESPIEPLEAAIKGRRRSRSGRYYRSIRQQRSAYAQQTAHDGVTIPAIRSKRKSSGIMRR